MKPLKHIFFDLDHTIWDFDRNAEETLRELYERYELGVLGLNDCDAFIKLYTENNHRLWAEYHLGRISKEHLRAERFSSTFRQLGLQPERIPAAFETDYVQLSPTKTNLFESALEVLGYLQDRYDLHIISNGFKETTLTKMQVCALGPFFKQVIISEDVGVNKPHEGIFEHALRVAGARKEESVMIGDSIEADVRGAQNFGMKAIFFNPNRIERPDDVTDEIHHLAELLKRF
ncbi:noncanonical pyrimidine nucleotidase, YjjG family [Pedobacter yulinensis]|uniref:Noncanonical pyrimidine nucleotidase, YjjG family n=1 Tax=Pedobacter yulinensis TaxID=2126353 RepID=A0A2T3HNJ5_9SPHI|nr:YjjG family noncanonical pyrimidine nucleotidase [Pedobacter yulinensis]PST84028.1 noncanonical pyrimidine nucleotidase, YjjG family [Pedobacter yulinensis]